jgi:xanthine dehydrogenase small subunit
MTDYIRPDNLYAAVQAHAANPEYMVLAGGTDLLVAMNRKEPPAGVIDLFGLSDIVGVTREDDGAIVIGAGTTFSQLLASEVIRSELPALAAAAREIGALQIQARGTIGGNVGTSSPVGDSLPVLLALDASIKLASPSGGRSIAYESFCTGYRKTAMAADELIVSILIPPRAPGTQQYWRKVGTRSAQSISKVMIAAAARLEDGVIVGARVALGAVADRPIRARAVEAALEGNAADEATITAARAALETEIKPIDDVRSNATYRLGVAQNLVGRFVAGLGGARA